MSGPNIIKEPFKSEVPTLYPPSAKEEVKEIQRMREYRKAGMFSLAEMQGFMGNDPSNDL